MLAAMLQSPPFSLSSIGLTRLPIPNQAASSPPSLPPTLVTATSEAVMPVTKTSALPATTAAAAAASPATTAAAAAALLHNHAQKHMKQHTVCLCTRIYNMNATPFSAWLISKHQLMIVRWAQVASLLLLVHIFRPHSFGAAYQLTSLLMLLTTCVMILAGQKGQHLKVSNELRSHIHQFFPPFPIFAPRVCVCQKNKLSMATHILSKNDVLISFYKGVSFLLGLVCTVPANYTSHVCSVCGRDYVQNEELICNYWGWIEKGGEINLL